MNDIEWMDGRTCLASVLPYALAHPSRPEAEGKYWTGGKERRQKPPGIVNQSINRLIMSEREREMR